MDKAIVLACSAIGAGAAVLGGLGPGVGEGLAMGKAAWAIGRFPEQQGTIMSTAIMGAAITETTAIYGLVVALILLFANPLIGSL